MAKRMDIFSIPVYRKIGLQSFQYCSYALTSTYTGGNKAILLMASTEFGEQSHGQASPTASQGVPKRYSSTIHIDPIRIQTRFTNDGK